MAAQIGTPNAYAILSANPCRIGTYGVRMTQCIDKIVLSWVWCVWYNERMKDNEIMGDAMDEYRAHQEQEAQEASSPLPKGWENAPLSAQVAWMVHGMYGEHDEFDSLKAELKGEI